MWILNSSKLTSEEISGVHESFGDGTELSQLLQDAEKSAEQYTSKGGTGRKSVEEQIENILKSLN